MYYSGISDLVCLAFIFRNWKGILKEEGKSCAISKNSFNPLLVSNELNCDASFSSRKRITRKAFWMQTQLMEFETIVSLMLSDFWSLSS